jgi:cyclopropane-fatty-acyl-phospholipid synthase
MTIVLGRIESGRIEVVEGGRHRVFGPADSGLRATITVRSPRFWPSFFRGSAGLARSYRDGEWECDDLVSLVRIGAREMPRLDRLRRPFNPFHEAFTRVARNTRDRARRHVAAHYDLGDDLFEVFLDRTMTYSCALFDPPHISLAEAQERKLDAICRKLELGPDDHVLEIGSGWGSFAIHAASRYGCRVTTTTISRSQHDTAVERVREARLSDRVEVLFEDYRDLRGRYDKLVSVEMIEAVGWQYFDDFFRRCSDLLAPDGLMLLQAILIEDDAYEAEKATRSFMNEFIFPSGCLPSMRVVEDCARRVTDMTVAGVEDITAHYPETLRRWRENFVAASARVAELGYDREFRRLWELYFAYCEGGFRERRITVAQLALAKPAYLRSLVNARFDIASISAAGPREASFARASFPPGPST